MKGRSIFSTVVILSAMASLNVQAESSESPFYFGASVGSANHSTNITNLTGTATNDETDSGFKVFAGYQLTNNVSFQLQYSDLGEEVLAGELNDTFTVNGQLRTIIASDFLAKSAMSSLGVSGLYHFNREGVFQPFVKLGFQQWDISANETSTAGNVSAKDDGFDIFYGVGLDVKVKDNISVRAEYEKFNLDSANDSTDKIYLATIGLVYNF